MPRFPANLAVGPAATSAITTAATPPSPPPLTATATIASFSKLGRTHRVIVIMHDRLHNFR